jgi:hypothetical protein
MEGLAATMVYGDGSENTVKHYYDKSGVGTKKKKKCTKNSKSKS